jgi:hypothetical protein
MLLADHARKGRLQTHVLLIGVGAYPRQLRWSLFAPWRSTQLLARAAAAALGSHMGGRAVRTSAQTWALIAVATAVASAPGGRALAARQIDIRAPEQRSIRVQECLNCSGTVTFTVTNTGVPDDLPASYTIVPLLAQVVGTDTENDVVQWGGVVAPAAAGDCDAASLPAASSCALTIRLNIRDADPSDVDHPPDDFGRWTAGFRLNWEITRPNGSKASGRPFSGSIRIDVTDQPVPEPGAWALLLLGLGAAGAAARLRRGPAIRAP